MGSKCIKSPQKNPPKHKNTETNSNNIINFPASIGEIELPIYIKKGEEIYFDKYYCQKNFCSDEENPELKNLFDCSRNSPGCMKSLLICSVLLRQF